MTQIFLVDSVLYMGESLIELRFVFGSDFVCGFGFVSAFGNDFGFPTSVSVSASVMDSLSVDSPNRAWPRQRFLGCAVLYDVEF